MMRPFFARLLAPVFLTGAITLAACSDSPTGVDTGTDTGTNTGTNTGTHTGTNSNPATAYNITIRYVGNSATARQKQAVEAAVERWQTVIASDEPDISGTTDANACFDGQPAMNERIDDIVIFVEFSPIDGPGEILGEAGPCFIRNDDGLPIIGHLELDQDDLLKMERNGSLDAVVLHEMGHILGIGTLWPLAGLLAGGGGTDPRFTGGQAITAYHNLGGLDATVPVEDLGDDGTRDGHWRESVFGNELMTGYISGSTNPLSAMTVASLRDMGYNANTSLASAYSFTSASSRVVASNALVDFHGAERMVAPKFLMNRDGSATAITGTTSITPWRRK
jgi:hypothetical protein